MTASKDRQWLVERVALQEATVGTELTASEQARLAELRADDEAIRVAYPAAEVAAEVRRRLRVEQVRATTGGGRRLSMVLAPALAATAAAALLVGVEPAPGPGDRPGREVTRLKGAALVLHRKTETGSAPLRTGDAATAGDRIQVGYRIDRAVFAVLLSIDGRGVVTHHLPVEGAATPSRLEPGAHQLPFSYQLDDAPAFERFILVTSPRSFSADEVRQAADRLARQAADVALKAPLELPDALAQLDFVLMKGDPR